MDVAGKYCQHLFLERRKKYHKRGLFTGIVLDWVITTEQSQLRHQHRVCVCVWCVCVRGGTVHRCHGSVRTSVRGSRFDTISVQQEKKKILLCLVSFHLFLTDSCTNYYFFQPRCENTKYYTLCYIYIYIYIYIHKRNNSLNIFDLVCR